MRPLNIVFVVLLAAIIILTGYIYLGSSLHIALAAFALYYLAWELLVVRLRAIAQGETMRDPLERMFGFHISAEHIENDDETDHRHKG